MPEPTNRFRPDILNNSLEIRKFLVGDQVIQELSLKRDTLFTPPSLCKRTLSTSWQIVTAPLTIIYSLFLKTISLLTHYLGMANISKSCSIRASHQLEPLAGLFMMWRMRSDILVPSINSHRLDTNDIYLQKDFAVTSLKDPVIYAATTHSFLKKDQAVRLQKYDERCENAFEEAGVKTAGLPQEKRDELFLSLRQEYANQRKILTDRNETNLAKYEVLNLYHDDGICNGMSLWFIYLYLKTQPFFKDPEQHLSLIAQYFSNGAPREASLLQTISPGSDGEGIQNILSLKLGEKKSFTKESDLAPGIYKLNAVSSKDGHATVLIKIDQETRFLFDPSHGLIKCVKEHSRDASTEITFNQFSL